MFSPVRCCGCVNQEFSTFFPPTTTAGTPDGRNQVQDFALVMVVTCQSVNHACLGSQAPITWNCLFIVLPCTSIQQTCPEHRLQLLEVCCEHTSDPVPLPSCISRFQNPSWDLYELQRSVGSVSSHFHYIPVHTTYFVLPWP